MPRFAFLFPKVKYAWDKLPAFCAVSDGLQTIRKQPTAKQAHMKFTLSEARNATWSTCRKKTLIVSFPN